MEDNKAYQEQSTDGSCFCNKVTFKVIGLPKENIICHCEPCRKSHTADSVHLLKFSRHNFEVTNGEKYIGEYANKEGAIRLFCTDCGTNICSVASAEEIITFPSSFNDMPKEFLNATAHEHYSQRLVDVQDKQPKLEKSKQTGSSSPERARVVQRIADV
jgi:hypothetical protein